MYSHSQVHTIAASHTAANFSSTGGATSAKTSRRYRSNRYPPSVVKGHERHAPWPRSTQKNRSQPCNFVTVRYTPLLVRSVSCVSCLPVGRPTLRLLVRSHGGRGADALGFRRNSTSSEATGRHWQQPVVSGCLRAVTAPIAPLSRAERKVPWWVFRAMAPSEGSMVKCSHRLGAMDCFVPML